jgi:hypothetical protein
MSVAHDSSFDFAAFEAKLAAYSPAVPLIGTRRIERNSFHAVWIGMVIVLISPNVLLPSLAQLWVAVIGACIEIAGIVVTVYVQAREIVPALRDQHVNYAREMDADYGHYTKVLAWLRGHDMAALRSRLAYARGVRDAMQRKLGLLTGNVDRLGVFPLMVALYFQFSSLTWPFEISLFKSSMAFILVVAYGLGLWVTRTRLRLDTYCQVLSEALESEPDRSWGSRGGGQ